jgi:hypothetical protein
VARIVTLTQIEKDRPRIHAVVDCAYSTFRIDGKTYLQIDTYGTEQRDFVGAISQSIQLDSAAAARLKHILRTCFPDT